jgi:hypothetical protein
MSRFAKRLRSNSLTIAIEFAAVSAGNPGKNGVPFVPPSLLRPNLLIGSPSPLPSPVFSAGPPQYPSLPGAGVVVPAQSTVALPPNYGYQPSPNISPNQMLRPCFSFWGFKTVASSDAPDLRPPSEESRCRLKFSVGRRYQTVVDLGKRRDHRLCSHMIPKS